MGLCRSVMVAGLSGRSILELSDEPMHGFITAVLPEICQVEISMFWKLR